MNSNYLFALSVALLGMVAMGESFGMPPAWGGMILILSTGLVTWSGLSRREPNHIDARVMFFAGLGLFGFVGGLLTGLFENYRGDFASVREPIAAILVASQIVWIGTNGSIKDLEPRVDRLGSQDSNKRGAAIAGLVAILVTAVAGTASNVSVAGQTLTSLALTAIIFSAVRLDGLQLPLRRRIFVSLLTLAAAVLYVLLVFQGGGRLVLLSLFAAVLWTAVPKLRLGRRRVLVIALIVVLPFASAIEQERSQTDFSISSIGFGGLDDGLLSVVDPLRVLDVMLNHRDNEVYRLDAVVSIDRPQPLGSTLLTPAVAPIPRAFWPGKPVGFGRLVVEVYDPQFAAQATSQSFAPTFLGEFIYSFGVWIGLPLASAFSIGLIRFIDGIHSVALRRHDAFGRTLAVLLAVNLPDFVWAGFGTFAVRGFFGGMALLIVGKFLEVSLRGRTGLPRLVVSTSLRGLIHAKALSERVP